MQSNWIKKAVYTCAAILIPALAFTLSAEREIKIIWRFMVFEFLSGHWIVFAIIILFLCICVRTLGYQTSDMKEVLIRHKIIFYFTIFIILLSTIPYVQVRYATFSQTSFQLKAIKLIQKRQYSTARNVCENYLSLYPQRREGNRYEDKICVGFLKYLRQTNDLVKYLNSYPVRNENMNEFVIPTDWSAKRYSIALLRSQISGKDTEYSPRQKTINIPEKVYQWAEVPSTGVLTSSFIPDSADRKPCTKRLQVASFTNQVRAERLIANILLITKNVYIEPAIIGARKFSRVIVCEADTAKEELVKSLVNSYQ